MRHRDLGCLLRFAVVLLGWSAAQGLVADELYYPGPGTQWEQRAPDKVDIDADKLAEAVKFAQAHEIGWLRDVRAQIEKDVAYWGAEIKKLGITAE